MIEAKSSGPSRCADDLTEADIGNLTAVLDHEIARNTMKNYRVQWSNFTMWAAGKGIRALPADPAQVAAYLAERIEEHGHKPATLRAAAAAIAFVHRTAGEGRSLRQPGGEKDAQERNTQGWQAPEAGGGAHSRSDDRHPFNRLQPSARPGRQIRRSGDARCRGNLDIALISLMRDAMLRVSEAAALTWRDIVIEADGTGRLLIRRSKTDSDGEGAVAFCPPRRWRR